MVSLVCRNGAKVELLQNPGREGKGPKLHRAKIEGSKTPQGKFGFNLCPAEFWTPQTLPCGVVDPQPLPVEFWSNATSAQRSFGDIVAEAKIPTKFI